MKIFLILLLSLSLLPTKAQKNKTVQEKKDIPTIAFCDLLRNPDRYHEKEVKLRAKYLSIFEVSAFVDSDCAKKENRTWVEFDRSSVEAATKPEVFKKVVEQIYCCMWAGSSSSRETEMLVTGIFYKSNGAGYGHDNEYCFKFTVKSVEDIGPTKEMKIPGLE
jgi:hypothetical protein